MVVQRSDNGFRYDMVVFDVGGTLVGFHDHGPFQQFLAQSGMPASAKDGEVLQRRLIQLLVQERDGAQGLGKNDDELYGWWRGIFDQLWSERSELADDMMNWLIAGRFDALFGDVMPALASLQAQHMPMGIISNFGAHLEALLVKLDVRRYVDFVIVSAIEGLAKPDPRIFERAASQSGLGTEGRFLYVGDHVGDDIQGARSAGWDGVLIDRLDRFADAHCARIHQLDELVRYIQTPSHPAPTILFDMDGVLLDSMPMHLVSWQDALEPLGVALTAADLYPLEGVPTERIAQKLTAKLLGKACSYDQAQELAESKRSRFREIFEPVLIKGMGPLLYDLVGRGYRLGLVTGSAQIVVDESLAPTGVVDLFDTIVAGDQVSEGKPHPEPYQIAAHNLDVTPSSCLVIENAPMGIQSAQAAGMRCVALETTLPADQLPSVERVFADTKRLRQWLLDS